MVDVSSAELAFRDIVVVGGGCYGSFYATQLMRARARGAVAWRRLLVVDRDPDCRAAGDAPGNLTLVQAEWGAFFDDWLDGAAGEDDAIVPSPLMPHLMFEWLERRAAARWPDRQVRRAALDTPGRTPFDMLHADGTRYLSHADWLCPVHCIEPATCPVIRATRHWEMGDTVADLARRRAHDRHVVGPLLFRCRHRVHGVGMFEAEEVLAADRALVDAARAGTPFEAVVGTISSCHGAVNVLAVGAVEEPSPVLY
jgi:hypothetical protein